MSKKLVQLKNINNENIDPINLNYETRLDTLENKETILYESTNGTTGNVTLTKNVSNYKKLLIVADRSGLNLFFTVEHDTSKNNNILLYPWFNTDLSKTQLSYEILTISGTTITRGTARYVNLPSGEGTSSGGLFKIYKVIGYK